MMIGFKSRLNELGVSLILLNLLRGISRFGLFLMKPWLSLNKATGATSRLKMSAVFSLVFDAGNTDILFCSCLLL